MTKPEPEEVVPKLPRGRGIKFSGGELFRIGMTIVTLVGVVVLTKPCASAVSGFVTGMDRKGSGEPNTIPKPGTVDIPSATPAEFEQLSPNMTEAELKAAIERAKARNTATDRAIKAAASGSAASGSASSGSAAP